ncbi:hypothetical protein F444_07753 [Phytophthora nicotianae P1976]|uniref:FLYWCH-type domain-containing protein n=1 Tax=Phytophthora nicotianae P1976 TaxID=1317066 RepID=A0A081ADP1_PHYNI|nr:hypothetical protein F444_07753 [Phytophthora nicotianae P1976]
MSRSPSSSRARRARYSPTSRPRTRSTSPHYTLEDNEASLLTLVESSPPTQPATPTPIQPPTLRLPSATGSYAASPLSQCSQPDQAVEGQALIPSSPGRPPRPPRVGSPRTFPHQQSRDGKTKIYHQGFEYTRAKISAVKITYRCSFYRKPKLCPAVLYFYADTMTYDLKAQLHIHAKADP